METAGGEVSGSPAVGPGFQSIHPSIFFPWWDARGTFGSVSSGKGKKEKNDKNLFPTGAFYCRCTGDL